MTTPSPYSTARIRSDFLDFFQSKGHTIVPSAPLVPGNDPTLLFTNSGMVQFKDVFLGAEKRSYVRAADVQRCLRAGGKHNDLDSVGYTARHHTFFEMLGNWSFGDYFKKDAIAWAWELLTQVWKLPAERLLVTVYHSDDEAYALWRDMIGVPEERIVRIGDNKGAPYASDNFWQMADTGPCGPCTEIFYDHGPSYFGGPPGSPDEDGDRFIEIWNLVFMQFDKQPDGTLVPLPAPCVDTGMGLERLAAILQRVHSNYEIDLFQALIRRAAELTGTRDLENKSLRVIADHIRACSFLIVDGVLPSNEGRGYVLRRIVRRALRHGWMLGTRQPFFHRLVGLLAELMGDAYPELAAKREFVERALLAEEERFGETLDTGMARLANDVLPAKLGFYAALRERGAELLSSGVIEAKHDDSHTVVGVVREPTGEPALVRAVAFSTVTGLQLGIGTAGSGKSSTEGDGKALHEFVYLIPLGREAGLEDWWAKDLPEMQAQGQHPGVSFFPAAPSSIIDGRQAFLLYDTYGFPVDLTADIAREGGLSVDMDGFEKAMEQQRVTARAAGKFGGGVQLPADLVAQLQPTQFVGYDALQAGGLVVQALLRDGRPVESIAAGDEAIVILDRTPFYAESGGQVGDTGELDEQGVRFRVSDTQKLAGQFHGHVGTLEAGTLRRGDHLLGAVDAARRGETLLNHSATHLLHGALRGLLGTHVAQKGSLVAPERLRFDFSHFQPVTGEELAEIERRVNVEVRANHPVVIRQMAMQEAIDAGAIALFGEKYGEQVRVVAMGDSVELCGGTHVARTGDIGLFKLVAEGGVSAGVRRVEALTGQAALDHVAAEERRLKDVAGLLGGTPGEAAEKLRALLDRQKKLEREVDAHKAKAASGATADLAAQAVERGGIKVLAARVEGLDAKALRDALDRLRQQLGDAAVVLAGASEGKVALVAGVSGAASGRIKAGELVGMVAGRIGGKGGGRPDMAQGGGSDGPALAAALADVPGWIETKLSPG